MSCPSLKAGYVRPSLRKARLRVGSLHREPTGLSTSTSILVENGRIKKVIREHHDGHAKTVGGTASPGTWSHVGNVDEGGAD